VFKCILYLQSVYDKIIVYWITQYILGFIGNNRIVIVGSQNYYNNRIVIVGSQNYYNNRIVIDCSQTYYNNRIVIVGSHTYYNNRIVIVGSQTYYNNITVVRVRSDNIKDFTRIVSYFKTFFERHHQFIEKYCVTCLQILVQS
jgi:hypothetical protein